MRGAYICRVIAYRLVVSRSLANTLTDQGQHDRIIYCKLMNNLGLEFAFATELVGSLYHHINFNLKTDTYRIN